MRRRMIYRVEKFCTSNNVTEPMVFVDCTTEGKNKITIAHYDSNNDYHECFVRSLNHAGKAVEFAYELVKASNAKCEIVLFTKYNIWKETVRFTNREFLYLSLLFCPEYETVEAVLEKYKEFLNKEKEVIEEEN